MLKLSKKGIKNSSEWEQAGIELPKFDVERMISETEKNPAWVHFGAGNIFRGYIASLQQDILDAGDTKTGIIAVETYDEEIIDKIYKPYDNLSLVVLMEPDGNLKKKVVASIADSLVGDPSRTEDWEKLKSIFRKSSLEMASFTITEKGYGLTTMTGDLLPEVKHDMENGPKNPKHVISKVAALAYARFLASELPITFVSMDNCSHNGEKLHLSLTAVIKEWVENKLVEPEFMDYISAPFKIAFPWTMIDKITPRPSDIVKDKLSRLGFADTGIICTNKNTYIAPFVNAEVPQYLVVEDHFPGGRPPLEHAGAIFTNRETVEKVERMKVTTCLNPLHSSLAIFGCILGYKLIADEMESPVLKALVNKIGYDEGMPVVIEPGVINPKQFIKEVIEKRLPNRYVPDTPQRIASDTSQKLAIRFGETIKSYAARADLDVKNLTCIPLTIAGWCRYLLAVDDNGEKFELSPDPLTDELKAYLSGIKLGDVSTVKDKLRPILTNKKLFGVDLYEYGLGQKVEKYFIEMIAGKNAVLETINRYVLH